MRYNLPPLLFQKPFLTGALESHGKGLTEKCRQLNASDFEGKSVELIAAELSAQFVVPPLELHESKLTVEVKDAKVDVAGDPRRAWRSDGGPQEVDGIEVTFHLPFSGDPELFQLRPSRMTFNPPRADVASGELRLRYQQPGDDVTRAKAELDRNLESLREWVSWSGSDVSKFNLGLLDLARSAVVARRASLDKRARDIADLGIPLRAEPDRHRSGAPPQKTPEDRSADRKRAAREFDVALSFAGEQREYVDLVAKELRRLGVEVFYDNFEKVDLWGADLPAHFGEIYGKRARFVVIFLSREYGEKAWPNHERQYILSRLLGGEQGTVLPVRFDSSEIAGLPPTIGFLDVRSLTPVQLAELIRQKVDRPN